MVKKYKSIWISDIHLGSSACKALELCNFLKNTECENLFLVGDIIDGWKLSRSWNWPQEHSNVIRRLLTKAKRGTKIFYILGNHDEFLRPWLKLKLNVGNIEISNEVMYVDSLNRSWIVTHGDLFDQVTRHYKWVSVLGDRAYTALLTMNTILNSIRSRLNLGYWSLSGYVKSKTKGALNFIYKYEENLAKYANSKQVHGIINGHIHFPSLKYINEVVYINDGDWTESCSALVETYSGEFQLLKLSKNNTMEVIKTYR